MKDPTTTPTAVFGVDVGGSGVKGAPVEVGSGRLLTARERIETPQPATPSAVTRVVVDLVAASAWGGPIGLTIPGVVRRGVVETAANIDPGWIGTDVVALMRDEHGVETVALNDADAAGVAEMTHGAGRGRGGVVVLVTFGTGIGTALFNDGVLVPNTELGHLELRGADAELHAAARVRKAEGLGWDEWGRRADEYLRLLDLVIQPDLIIVGGGVSKKADRWLGELTLSTEVVPAELRNDAGIVGAAMAAAAMAAAGAARLGAGDAHGPTVVR